VEAIIPQKKEMSITTIGLNKRLKFLFKSLIQREKTKESKERF